MNHQSTLSRRNALLVLAASTTLAGSVPPRRAGVSARTDHPEVLVYGATPGGIASALAAANGGLRVLLVEPTSRIGGMVTHGLSHTDFHSFEALSGPFLRFSQLVLEYYRETNGKDSVHVMDSFRGTHGEPSVNLRVFQSMLAEQPSIATLTDHRLTSVTVEDYAITKVTFGDREFRPGIVIDATYEGDLLAAAGVPYRVGREAQSEFGESLAPETADDQLQAYNFRLCMTQDAANRVPIPVPPNYHRKDYADITALVESGQIEAAFAYPSKCLLKAHQPHLPNGKYDINDVSKGLVRLSLPGRNLEFPDCDLDTRRRIEREHLDWQLGLIHFAQTDPALPESFRQQAAAWGLCRDEFSDANHLPAQIYVREARRMVGLHVYTERDTEYAPGDARAKLHRDSIAVGEYSHNCHGTGHDGPRIGGHHTGEFYKAVAPYQIPYGVIVPKEMRNLLVPVACSASHVGFCALRLEPIWMSLGAAAGNAARQAIQRKIPIQDVDVAILQTQIQASGGATIHASDVLPDHPDFAAVQWWGMCGGLHGLEPAPKQPGTRGAHITSQYFEAYPGHQVHLEKPLDASLAASWNRLLLEEKSPSEQLPGADAGITRGDWIRAAYVN